MGAGTTHTRPQNRPVGARIILDCDGETDGITGYFGVAVQYAMSDDEKHQYGYYLQGYIENSTPMVDYV